MVTCHNDTLLAGKSGAYLACGNEDGSDHISSVSVESTNRTSHSRSHQVFGDI